MDHVSSCNIYVSQLDTQCFMIKFIHDTWWLDLFRTSMVRNMSSHQVSWINSIIKHCVSSWFTYILHVSFIFSLEWDKCSPSGSKDTAHSNHGVGLRASYNMMMTGSPSLGQSDPRIGIINLSLFTSLKTIEITTSKPIMSLIYIWLPSIYIH